jgi:hypothetical protein
MQPNPESQTHWKLQANAYESELQKTAAESG